MRYTVEQALRDKDALLLKSANAEAEGDLLTAMVLRVEAHNCIGRVGMTKLHSPSLGPYSSINPMHCRHCGKPGADWADDHEECKPSEVKD